MLRPFAWKSGGIYIFNKTVSSDTIRIPVGAAFYDLCEEADIPECKIIKTALMILRAINTNLT